MNRRFPAFPEYLPDIVFVVSEIIACSSLWLGSVFRIDENGYHKGPAYKVLLETEPGYVFLPQQMLDLYHGQHGSRDDSNMIVPIICFGAGIPSGVGIEPSDLRCIAPMVCRLMGLPSGDFDLGTPALLETQDRTILNP